MFDLLRKKKRKKEPLSPELQAYFETPEGKEDLKRYFATEEGKVELSESIRQEIREAHPKLLEALWGDACVYSSLLMGPPKFTTKAGWIAEMLRLSLDNDAFFPMVLYRIRARFLAHGAPVAPQLLHRLSMVLAQIDIGANVAMESGVYIPHGQVVIDGQVRIGSGTVISPWTTLGRNGDSLDGPTIGRHVFIGTGAKLLGPIHIGDHARIGANAVVLKDVPAYATVGGVPAKVLRAPEDNERMRTLRDAIRREAEKQAQEDGLPASDAADPNARMKAALRAAAKSRNDAQTQELREAVRQRRLEQERAKEEQPASEPSASEAVTHPKVG